jgi:CO/xanthine dehydrogenase FAD-binding subunit
LSSFDYIRAVSLEEAAHALKDGDGKILAGGTDLIVQLKQGKVRPRRVIDVTRIPALRRLKEENGNIVFGAGVTFRELIASPLVHHSAFPLVQMASQMGSLQIRNMATLGGNMANGSPSADSLVPLLALETTVRLQSIRGNREITLLALLEAPPGRTALPSDEVIVEIRFPRPASNARSIFLKLGRRNAVNIARLSLCAILTFGPDRKIGTAAIAVGSASPHPVRIATAEKLLSGSALGPQLLEEAVEEITRDVAQSLGNRASAPYKSLAIRGLSREALEYCFNLGEPQGYAS